MPLFAKESGSGAADPRSRSTSSRGLTSSRLADHARRGAPLWLALAALLIVGIVLSVGHRVGQSIRESTGHSLSAILASNVTALESWLRTIRTEVDHVAQSDAVDAAAHQLLDRFADGQIPSASELGDDPAYRQFIDALAADDQLGWVLVDDKARVVASDIDELVGQTLAIPEDALRRLRARSSTVCRPFRLPVAIDNEGRFSRQGAAAMGAMAPVTSGGRAVGGIARLIDPMDRFTALMSATWRGETGDTYAFDRKGVLISRCRFEDDLRAAGLLDLDPLVSSPLNISIRDPGTDVTSGGKPRPIAERPLTWMADRATRGATGENLDGYVGYRGVPVVGAWRWLPEYGIGVAVEVDVAEAFYPIRLMTRSFFSLLAVMAVVGVAWGSIRVVSQHRGDGSRRAHRTARRLGQYDLGEMIGRGGMGAVYRGTHQLLRREVAIKVLEGREVNSQSVSRFEREVQMTARLRHPNTIDIYDYGHADDDTFFYVMEYIDGITLQELVEQYGRQPPARVIHLLLQVCGSLSEAHQLGMIHRDIKPSNILLTAGAGLYDMIKVLDFGLVKEVDRETVNLTQSSGITGTPMYMSPEAVRDAATADQQSDLYSVGAVGYTLLTGLPTFDGDSSVDVCWKQLNEDPLRPCERIASELPDDLQNVLMSCLRKDPKDRPMSIDDLEAALRQCDDAGSWSAADALHWWEMEFQAANHDLDQADDEDGTLAGREGSGTTAR